MEIIKNTFWYLYQTKASKNIYPIEIGFKTVISENIIYDPQKIRNLCRIGCSNYGKNGGCPPFSPLLEKMNIGKDVFLIYARLWSKYKPDKVKNSNIWYIHASFTDNILARLTENLAYEIKSNIGYDYLGTGYCLGCRGKKCNFKLGENYCRNPLRRSYSMESTGIDVEKTVKNTFDIDLKWYKKLDIKEVDYMLKCFAVIPREEVTEEKFFGILIENLNKLDSTVNKLFSDQYYSILNSLVLS